MRPGGETPGTAGQASCIYEGTIRHRRAEPRTEWTHSLALAYIDLAELPSLLGGRLTRTHPGRLRFRRRDYLGDPRRPLESAVAERVAALGGAPPEGPIRILTQLRSYGVCFNPVSFYYCLDADGLRVRTVLAEVTNTPWGERHAYLLSMAGDAESGVLRGSFAKELHVSPFMGMDHVYAARATPPGSTLSVHIESRREGRTVFDATLGMSRRELTRASAARMAGRYAPASGRMLALIYGHALGLKLAGAGLHPHPPTPSAAGGGRRPRPVTAPREGAIR